MIHPKKKAEKEGLYIFLKDREQLEKVKRLISRGHDFLFTDNALDVSDLIDSISLLSIEIWRLERRINRAKDAIDSSITDQLQRIKDILQRQKIEICEYTGSDYNDGMSVKVLSFEVVDDLPSGKERVIETIKPSIYYKGKIIFHGEVIVGKSKKGVSYE